MDWSYTVFDIVILQLKIGLPIILICFLVWYYYTKVYRASISLIEAPNETVYEVICGGLYITDLKRVIDEQKPLSEKSIDSLKGRTFTFIKDIQKTDNQVLFTARTVHINRYGTLSGCTTIQKINTKHGLNSYFAGNLAKHFKLNADFLN